MHFFPTLECNYVETERSNFLGYDRYIYFEPILKISSPYQILAHCAEISLMDMTNTQASRINTVKPRTAVPYKNSNRGARRAPPLHSLQRTKFEPWLGQSLFSACPNAKPGFLKCAKNLEEKIDLGAKSHS